MLLAATYAYLIEGRTPDQVADVDEALGLVEPDVDEQWVDELPPSPVEERAEIAALFGEIG